MSLALAVLLAPFGALSQILPLDTYTTADGLLSNRILTAIQDPCGYLWMGTPEGVSVFDGVSFTNFTQAEGLAGSYVTSIAESKSMPGTVWEVRSMADFLKSYVGKLRRCRSIVRHMRSYRSLKTATVCCGAVRIMHFSRYATML